MFFGELNNPLKDHQIIRQIKIQFNYTAPLITYIAIGHSTKSIAPHYCPSADGILFFYMCNTHWGLQESIT